MHTTCMRLESRGIISLLTKLRIISTHDTCGGGVRGERVVRTSGGQRGGNVTLVAVISDTVKMYTLIFCFSLLTGSLLRLTVKAVSPGKVEAPTLKWDAVRPYCIKKHCVLMLSGVRIQSTYIIFM